MIAAMSRAAWRRVLVAVVILGGLALFGTRFFFFQPFNAPSVSMSPTLNEGDFFLVSLRAYSGHDPERGDVAVFRSAKGDFVKRIVGIPADRVQMIDGRFFLNGKAVARRRIENFSLAQYGVDMVPVRQFVETLPSGRSYRTLDAVDGARDLLAQRDLDRVRLCRTPDADARPRRDRGLGRRAESGPLLGVDLDHASAQRRADGDAHRAVGAPQLAATSAEQAQ